MRKIAVLLMASVIATSFLASCGNNSGEAGQTSNSSKSQVESTQEEWKSLDNAISSQNAESNKTYFEENINIETPDSWDSSIRFDSKYEGIYYYIVGTNKSTATKTFESYLAYLEDLGYAIEDISYITGDTGAEAYSLENNGTSEANIYFSYFEENGYVMGISWR